MASIVPAVPAGADPIGLQAAKDNTLYESQFGDTGNGVGEYLFVGRTNSGNVRRALVKFNLSAIPAGSTINSATLTFFMSRTTSGTQSQRLHRVLGDWGEGTSDSTGNEGGGAVAVNGDATWLHRFRPSLFWTAQGGDFVATMSASANVGGIGFVSWTGAAMTTDVQGWFSNPSTNFGWIIIGNEASNRTTKRFDSRENPTVSRWPVLIVDYTPAAPTGACCIRTPQDSYCDQTLPQDCAVETFVCDAAGYVPPSTAVCFADVDADGIVIPGDRGFISANDGQANPMLVCRFDLDGNGVINPADRGFVSANVGLCTALPDFQNGSGMNHGVPDARFGGAVFHGVGTSCASVACP